MKTRPSMSTLSIIIKRLRSWLVTKRIWLSRHRGQSEWKRDTTTDTAKFQNPISHLLWDLITPPDQPCQNRVRVVHETRFTKARLNSTRGLIPVMLSISQKKRLNKISSMLQFRDHKPKDFKEVMLRRHKITIFKEFRLLASLIIKGRSQ